MQIIIDADEQGKISIDTGVTAAVSYDTTVEALTGADMVISPLNIPWGERFLKLHLNAGAVLVQVKRGMDFTSSIAGSSRLKDHAERMGALTGNAWQKVLLFVGLLNQRMDESGEWVAEIDGRLVKYYNSRRAHMPMEIVDEAKASWKYWGGVFETVYPANTLSRWVQTQINVIEKMKALPEREFYHNSKTTLQDLTTCPMQTLRSVPLWKMVLVQFPGVGKKAIEELEKVYGNNVVAMLTELTHPVNQGKNVYGIGKTTVDKIRAAFSIHPWQYIGGLDIPAIANEYGADYWDSMRCGEQCPLWGQAGVLVGSARVACDQKCDEVK